MPLIVIDGPSGVGKTSVAVEVAKRLGLKAVSTGALYRAVALYLKRRGVDLRDEEEIKRALEDLHLDQRFDGETITTYINGEDVTREISSDEVSDLASHVSSLAVVREYLLDVQREIAGEDAVVEGRDMGTVVFPDADIKIFLDANLGERAKRRFRQLKARGVEVDFEQLKLNMKKRDHRDKSRGLAPLRIPKDAFYIDTSYMSLEDVVNKITRIAKELVV